jgi:hypothetical protein
MVVRVGAKYKSFTDLECALKKSSRIITFNFISVAQGSLVQGPNIKNMEVAESSAGF